MVVEIVDSEDSVKDADDRLSDLLFTNNHVKAISTANILLPTISALY